MNKLLILILIATNVFSQIISLQKGWSLYGATEDINDISSLKNNDCNIIIYVFKNNKILKAQSTDNIQQAQGFWIHSSKTCNIDTNQKNTNTNQNEYEIKADIWADNWFAMYKEDTLIKQDSVSINTERSFNAESFTFTTKLPTTLSFIIKDFKQDDTGLEYINSDRQQIGDGGFIAQFKNSTNQSLLVSNNSWKCTTIHKAPLNKECEKSKNPTANCKSQITKEPNNWKSNSYNTSSWNNATIYSNEQVRPKEGYDKIQWDNNAKLIWTSDLKSDNTILCKVELKSKN